MPKERENPWLLIPATDYEGHMGHPEVGQSLFLARVFEEACSRYDPSSTALLGCTTGNGLEHIDARRTRSVLAVDINPEYLEILKGRYGSRISGLTTLCGDLLSCRIDHGSLSLAFAGLLFEYVDPSLLLPRIFSWLAPRGVCVAVLQLPVSGKPEVTDTPFSSLKLLGPVMRLVETEAFEDRARACGFELLDRRTITLDTGKPFWIGAIQKPGMPFKQAL